MITVNMHEAKTRLSQLVAAAIDGEEVIVCADGKPRVRLAPVVPDPQIHRDLTPNPRFAVKFSPEYDPTEPLTDDEWPEDCK